MSEYLINKKKTDGKYNEMHKNTCLHLPSIWNRDNLGSFVDDDSALTYAKTNGYPDADGCAYCCKAVNHR